MVRVLIADDQPNVRAGIRALLERTADIVVVGEAADGAAAVRMAAELRPDVVLMDVRMPDRDGIAATREIVAGSPGPTPQVIVLTTFDLDEYVFGALREGASGFLTKNVAPDELRRAVRLVAEGQALLDPAVTRRVIEQFAAPSAAGSAPAADPAAPVSGPAPPAGAMTPAVRSAALDSLTPREREVARLVARGLTNEEISVSLFLSIWTVKTHVSRILAKLGARERAQIVIAMYEAGGPHIR